MKLKFMLLVIFMLLNSGISLALLKCPAPGPEDQEIINRLETFSEEMVIDESCKNLKRDAQAMQSGMMCMGGFFDWKCKKYCRSASDSASVYAGKRGFCLAAYVISNPANHRPGCSLLRTLWNSGSLRGCCCSWYSPGN